MSKIFTQTNTDRIKDNVRHLALKYLNELVEAFITIMVIKVIINKKFDFPAAIRFSIVLAVITTIIETYNPLVTGVIKNSVIVSGVSQVLKSI